MAKLPKYTLEYDEKKEKWVLEEDRTSRTIRAWDTKEEATARGVLGRAVGEDGGSVKIQKANGRYQEERTFPRSADPEKSKG
ncbi:MAG: DUF2188 domain-containing protein [Myxococcota bacterium]